MGTQEWILLGVVLVLPLIIAIAVTLWTLEQAIKRNRKNRPDRAARRVAEPVADAGPLPATGAAGAAATGRDSSPEPNGSSVDTGPADATPASATATPDAGGDGGSTSD